MVNMIGKLVSKAVPLIYPEVERALKQPISPSLLKERFDT
jgi:hypothetical protein